MLAAAGKAEEAAAAKAKAAEDAAWADDGKGKGNKKVISMNHPLDRTLRRCRSLFQSP